MIEITLTLKPKTFYAVTSSTKHKNNNTYITEFYKGLLYSQEFILSSSIKGMIRTSSVFAITTLFGKEYSCETTYQDKTCGDLEETEINALKYYPCPICRTYGTKGLRARCKILLDDGFSLKQVSSVKERQINFLHNILRKNKNAFLVETSSEEIKVRVICEDKLSALIVLLGLPFINEGIIRLGRYKSRGFGIFEVEFNIIGDDELVKYKEAFKNYVSLKNNEEGIKPMFYRLLENVNNDKRYEGKK